MSFKINNSHTDEVVNKSLLKVIDNYSQVSFCQVTITDLPLYIIKNGDTGGNVPEGANYIEGGYWTRIPINQFLGVNNGFEFDGNYLWTYNPGYYFVSVHFTLNCTDNDSSSHNMELSFMNQSDGYNNLYFPFVVTTASTNYSFSGIIPTSMHNNNTGIGELHFSFNSNDEFTFKISSISISLSFYS